MTLHEKKKRAHHTPCCKQPETLAQEGRRRKKEGRPGRNNVPRWRCTPPMPPPINNYHQHWRAHLCTTVRGLPLRM